MWMILEQGGALIWLILGLSVVAVAVIAERLVRLRTLEVDAAAFLGEIQELVAEERIDEAVAHCEDLGAPIAQVCRAGLMKHDRPREEIREAIEDAGSFEIPRLERHLGILQTIAHICPLIGLLGTVIGMISVFQEISLRQAEAQLLGRQLMAKGIWEALLTTAAGLVVAIPTYVAHNYLAGRAEATMIGMERSATELVDLLAARRERNDLERRRR